VLPQTAHYSFAYYQMLVVFAGTICLFGIWIGSRHFTLAPELGRLVMGAGILAMHVLARHIVGTTQWNVYGVVTSGNGRRALAPDNHHRTSCFGGDLNATAEFESKP
jgi:NO-binding membrane sensor protein with MHYT domain